MRRPTQRTNHRSGLTIVEVLASLAALVALLALGLPVIARGGSASGVAVSLSNLQQMNTAFAAYANDFNGRQPTAIVDNFSRLLSETATPDALPPRAFSTVFVVDFPSCVGVQLTYNSTSVTATIVGDTCPGDIAPIASGGNALVNVDDLLAVINAWGSCADPNNCPADIAPAGSCGNDLVNVDDLLAVINAWGVCP